MAIGRALAWVVARPLVVAVVVAGAGIAIRALGLRRLASWLWISAAAIIYVATLSPVGDALLSPLERRYNSLAPNAGIQGAEYIAVMGSSYRPRDSVPSSATLDDEGLVRIVEGVRLVRLFGLPLIASGGAVPGANPPALGYARLAVDLGINPDTIIISANGIDTRAEALSIAKLVGDKPFIVVTSASHMPRVMRLLLLAGTHPIPAPTAQRVMHDSGPWWVYYLLPSTTGLRKVELALHEYLGLAAIRLGLD